MEFPRGKPDSASRQQSPERVGSDTDVESYLARPTRKVGWVVPFTVDLEPSGRLANVLGNVSGGMGPRSVVRHVDADVWTIELAPKLMPVEAAGFVNSYLQRARNELVRIVKSFPEAEWAGLHRQNGNRRSDVIIDLFGVVDREEALRLAISAIDCKHEVLHTILSTDKNMKDERRPTDLPFFRDPQDLIDKYADIDAQRAVDVPAALGMITLKQAAVEQAREELEEAVRAARAVGAPWTAIGEAAGMSHQAAHQRWSEAVRANRRSDPVD